MTIAGDFDRLFDAAVDGAHVPFSELVRASGLALKDVAAVVPLLPLEEQEQAALLLERAARELEGPPANVSAREAGWRRDQLESLLEAALDAVRRSDALAISDSFEAFSSFILENVDLHNLNPITRAALRIVVEAMAKVRTGGLRDRAGSLMRLVARLRPGDVVLQERKPASAASETGRYYEEGQGA